MTAVRLAAFVATILVVATLADADTPVRAWSRAAAVVAMIALDVIVAVLP